MANRGPAFLGFPNIINEPYCVISTTGFSGLEPADMVGSFLATEEPSEVSRLTLLDPKHSQWVCNFSGLSQNLDGFSLINHNLIEGDSFRVLGFIFTVTPWVYLIQAANAIASSSNMTGVVSSLDDPIDTPDGLTVGPTTSNADWDFKLTWANLSPVPRTGSEGFFVLRMQRQFSGAGATNPTELPKVTVDLYEGGIFKRSLGYRPVTESAAGGQILIFPFAFSELSSPNGNDIECLVTVTTASSPSGHQYAVLESLLLYYEEAPVIPMFDSGWITTVGKDTDSPTMCDHYFPLVEWENVRSVVLLIRSDQVVKDVPLNPNSGRIPYPAADATPDSFVEAGIFNVGQTQFLSTAIGIGKGPLSRVLTQVLESGSTVAGQSYASDIFRRRAIGSMSIVVSRDELLFLQKEIAWKKGRSGPFYVALEPDIDSEYQAFLSFWATLSELGEPVEMIGAAPGSEMMFTVSIGFEEKL